MCGRYTLTKPFKSILAHFNIAENEVDFRERFNIAPTQTAPVIIAGGNGNELRGFRWGLIPSWAKDQTMGSGLINARAETVHQKPGFKNSFKDKRCLVPADGFIEWQKKGKDKLPIYCYLQTRGLFAFAGLWAEWNGPDGVVRSYSIITTQANSLLREFHDRMPVMLSPGDCGAWLDPGSPEDNLRALLTPFPADFMQTRRISKAINSPKNDRPDCLETYQ